MPQEIICCKCKETTLGYSNLPNDSMVCDSCIEDFYRYMTVEEIKVRLCDEVDEKSNTLIYCGHFDFDGEIFSMSKFAQLNNTQLAAEIGLDLQTLPQAISTKDDKIFYIDADNFEGFFTAMSTFKKGILIPGAQLRIEINACETKEELKLIIDNR